MSLNVFADADRYEAVATKENFRKERQSAVVILDKHTGKVSYCYMEDAYRFQCWGPINSH